MGRMIKLRAALPKICVIRKTGKQRINERKMSGTRIWIKAVAIIVCIWVTRLPSARANPPPKRKRIFHAVLLRTNCQEIAPRDLLIGRYWLSFLK